MIKKIFGGFFALLLIQLLVACGSGDDCEFTGGCGGTVVGGGGSSSSRISLKMVSMTTGLEVENISAAEPVRLVATVSGVAKSVIVEFSTTKGTLSDSGSALTNEGQAAVELTASETSGAGEAKATVVIDDETYEDTVLFQVVSGASGITLTLLSSVSGLETNRISISDPGRLVARVAGITDEVIVNFDTTLGTVSNSGSVLSDVLGEATVDLLPGTDVGAGMATASVTIGSNTLSVSTVFEIAASDSEAGVSLQFVSATPETISLKGAGGDVGSSETSVVEFKVLGSSGDPVSGQEVQFALNTTSGGIALDPATGISDASGLVRTIVTSGTTATSVRVTASLVDAGKTIASVQSSRLVISTGIPDQDSFSLAATVLNSESWEVDGLEVTVTARLADGFNNPVPDGTVVYFSTEGGAINPYCLTVGGACDVVWTSQEPRPWGPVLASDMEFHHYQTWFDQMTGVSMVSSLGQPYGGRVTVTATAIGEESFPDLNGNGRFDASEMTAFLGNDLRGLPYDLDEVFADYNEDTIYNPTQTGESGGDLEELVDFNSNGLWDAKDGKYNGSLCSIPAHDGCSAVKTVNVRGQTVLIMSGSSPNISLQDLGGVALLCISDLHNQPMPADTSVSVKWGGGFIDPDGVAKDTTTTEFVNTVEHGPICFLRNIYDNTIGSTVNVVTKTPRGMETSLSGGL